MIVRKYDDSILLFRQFISDNIESMDHIHILNIIHKCSKLSIEVSRIIDWDIILYKLENYENKLNAQSISIALYSLNNINYLEESVLKRYLSLITRKLANSDWIVNGQFIG